MVFSKREFNQLGHSILAMITSSVHDPWPRDSELEDCREAGLHVPCKVRFKLFTLDNRLILRAAGKLSTEDKTRVANQLRATFV